MVAATDPPHRAIDWPAMPGQDTRPRQGALLDEALARLNRAVQQRARRHASPFARLLMWLSSFRVRKHPPRSARTEKHQA